MTGVPVCAPGSILGYGQDLRVLLMTKGGGKIIAELNPDFGSGAFHRALNGTTICSFEGTTNALLDRACCENYLDVYQWATELAVIRDDRDAWVGPVTDVVFEYGKVKIEASDLTAWWDRRFLPSSAFVNVDIATIFDSYHREAMAPDPSPNFTINATPTGILATRSVMAADYSYARDRLDELTNTGIDWTAYGRNILVGGQEIPSAPYVTLLDEHFSIPPKVHARGNDQATRVVVKGVGVTGVAEDADYIAFYGLLERRFEEPNIKDQASVDAAAQSRLDFLKDPVYLETPSDAALKATAPITLPELIPGIRVRVNATATCRELVRDFRLSAVTSKFTGEVSITLQPIGTVSEG